MYILVERMNFVVVLLELMKVRNGISDGSDAHDSEPQSHRNQCSKRIMMICKTKNKARSKHFHHSYDQSRVTSPQINRLFRCTLLLRNKLTPKTQFQSKFLTELRERTRTPIQHPDIVPQNQQLSIKKLKGQRVTRNKSKIKERTSRPRSELQTSHQQLRNTTLKKSRIQKFPKKSKAFQAFDFLCFTLGVVVNLHTRLWRPSVYVGKGNNAELVKSLVRSRPWLELTEDQQSANLVWTQNLQPQMHAKQMDQAMLFITNYSSNQVYLPPKKSYPLVLLSQKQRQDLRSGLVTGLTSHFIDRPLFLHNHLPNATQISDKKNLLKNLKAFYQERGDDPFKHMPLSFHIKGGAQDSEFEQFKKAYCKFPQGQWIIKPGQQTNRGEGIQIQCDFKSIRNFFHKKAVFHKNGEPQTFVIQQYISRPLLYAKRKFDIRHFVLLLKIHNRFRAFWMTDAYIRTSSLEYALQDFDNQFIHLTNDAIQRSSSSYGRYQEANKLTYRHLQRRFEQQGIKVDLEKQILPKFKQLGRDVIEASHRFLNTPEMDYTFQLFGLDFMIDHEFTPWLIEVNSNPCLQTNCSLLHRTISSLLDSVFKLTLDVVFPATDASKQNSLQCLNRLKAQLLWQANTQLQQKF